MARLSRPERIQLAEDLQLAKYVSSLGLTRRALELMPGLRRRFGPSVERRTYEDFTHIQDHLAVAVVLDSAAGFRDFVCWTQRVLLARGVPADVLATSLGLLATELATQLSGDEKSLVQAILGEGLEALKTVAPADAMGEELEPISPAAGAFREAVLAGDSAAALSVVRSVYRPGLAMAAIHVDVVQAALHDVGRLWERDDIGVADEHLAYQTTLRVLDAVADWWPRQPERPRRAVVACVQGECHHLGARLAADALAAAGWRVHYLGGDVPTGSLAAAVRKHEAGLLAVSVTLWRHLPQLQELVAAIRERHGPEVRILAGGAALRYLPDGPAELRPDHVVRDLRELESLLVGPLAT